VPIQIYLAHRAMQCRWPSERINITSSISSIRVGQDDSFRTHGAYLNVDAIEKMRSKNADESTEGAPEVEEEDEDSEP
jgi:hypothetical protein